MINRGYTLLRRRLLLTFLLLALTPLTALGLFCIDSINATYAEKISSNLEAIASSKRRAVDTFMVERVAQIRNLAAMHSYAELTSPARLSEIFTLMQSHGRSFIDIGVIGRDGKHITYVGPYDLGTADYSQEAWFQEVLRRGVYVSDVFMGFRKVPHFIIAVLRHEGGHTFILRATIDMGAVTSLLKRLYSGRLSEAFLVNRQGVMQTDSAFYGKTLSKTAFDLPPDSGKEEIVIERVDSSTHDPRNQMAAIAWLHSIPWALVIVDDVAETLSPLQQMRWMVGMFVIIGGIIAGLGAVWASRSMVSYLSDLDSKQAELDARMLQSSKMAALGKMAAGVAHEINNPLMLIRESAGWIRDLLEEEDPETIRNYDELMETATKIEKHVDRAKGVTHRMLGFGRRMDPTHQEISLNSLADQTIAFLESEARARNIQIVREYATDLPTIRSDPAQLQQVILNIVDNALDAVAKDGTVTVRTFHAPDGGCCLSVRDSGAGIAPEVLRKIFDPFFTTKNVGEGTGLGLAICFSILEKLGGHITADSTPGEGATFTVYLPAESDAADAGSRESRI